MDTIIGPPIVNSSALTRIVRRALQIPTLQVTEWCANPLTTEITNPATGGLYRFAGTGEAAGRSVPWSLVLKIARLCDDAPDGWGADLHHFSYWKREALTYRSELLQELPGELQAPRCFEVSRQPDGSEWIWLEEVRNDLALWSLPRYGQIARHFGRWQGVYPAGRPLPPYSWLQAGWLRSWLSHFDVVMNYARRPETWEDPLVRRAFPVPIAEHLVRLWNERSDWLDILDRLPQTVCHFDVWRPNLFIKQDEAGEEHTVAVDWQSVGIGPMGEIGNLLITALMNREVLPGDARELDSIVWNGYLQGLQEAGWKGDERAVRFGYTAYPALRWGWVFPMLMVLPCVLDDNRRLEAEAKYGLPIEDLLEQWADVCYFLLDLAEEARGLARSL